ncbi:MAG: hypothetical protein F6K55_07605 [Moorea sp. SIO4A3]|nr:hypothetical protein [Moorena sp. SIO4A3]
MFVPCSLLPVPYSLLPAPCSLFPVPFAIAFLRQVLINLVWFSDLRVPIRLSQIGRY